MSDRHQVGGRDDREPDQKDSFADRGLCVEPVGDVQWEDGGSLPVIGPNAVGAKPARFDWNTRLVQPCVSSTLAFRGSPAGQSRPNLCDRVGRKPQSPARSESRSKARLSKDRRYNTQQIHDLKNRLYPL
ncbi:hypothetical protein MAPG_09964 [Magnaporthiopsis poae ATCC 64411]|uniref:Uncharacterized protein n=1 Tax=Magnaporthiopsis poae (strain ATCC 64411 / 73-15) TaxID=644358 RepID=A0A0C4EBB6_MAGP6|nr:hypothetical protein MAPG_09964 [Magnaporthiopsis poae ATCC 64411]